MLTEIEKERISARCIGEALREVAVLVLVFVPLDWILGRHEDRLQVAFGTLSVALLVFAAGIKVGYAGEEN